MNDDWMIENLRVTLFSPKHKERVIIQNNRDDLRITTRESEESIRQDVPGKTTVDKKAARKEAPAPEARAARAAAPSPSANASPPPTPTPTPPPPTPTPPETPERTSSSLKWDPTEDAGYTGYSAESRDGEFVLLKTKRSLWALYFSWGRGVHVGLGCFHELKDGKVAAQKQHDEGPVPRPNGKITVEMVEKACPAPPEPEPPAAAAPPEPAAAPTTEPFAAFTPKPPRRARAKKSAAEPESPPAPEVQKPASEAPKAEEIEIDPNEATKMLGQLKGLLDQEN